MAKHLKCYCRLYLYLALICPCKLQFTPSCLFTIRQESCFTEHLPAIVLNGLRPVQFFAFQGYCDRFQPLSWEMSFNMSVPTINPLSNGGMSHSSIACSDKKCSHGRCVVVNEVPTCECKLGYTGDTCNETVNEALSLPLTLGTVACIITFITLMFVLAFFWQKQKAKRRKRAAEEERRNGAHV